MTIDLDAIQALAKLAREETLRPGWPYQASGEWTNNVIGMLGGATGDFAGALSPDVVDGIIANVRRLERDAEHWQTLAEKLGDRAAEVREFAYDLGHDPDSVDIAASINRVLNGGYVSPRVLDGDPEVIEAALDALPVGSIVESSAEAVAGQEPRVWARESNGLSRDHIGWRGTGRMTMFGSDYLAKYCAPLVVISR